MASEISHQMVGRAFLAQVHLEIQAGELLQGSEKLCGAVAHMTEAVADQMG